MTAEPQMIGWTALCSALSDRGTKV